MTQPFATPADLANRLQRPVWTVPAELAQVEAFLADASEDLRAEIGWQVYPPAEITAPAVYDSRNQLVVHGLPRGAVAVVRNADGTASVRYTVGYAQPPAELVRWTCVLAAEALDRADKGIHGAAPATLAVDDFRVGFSRQQQQGELPIPPRVLERLRSTYGSTVFVT